MITKVLINGIDIVKQGYTNPTFTLEEELDILNNTIVLPTVELEILDYNGGLSELNPAGMFYGNDYTKFNVEIYNELDELYFRGYVRNVTTNINNNNVSIELENYNRVFFESDITYVIDEPDLFTPAMVIYDMLLLNGLKSIIDETSFRRVIDYERNKGLYIGVTVLESGIKLGDVVQKLAYASGNNIYFTNSKLYISKYLPIDLLYYPVFTFINSDIVNEINVTTQVDYIRNQFNCSIKGSSTDPEVIFRDEDYNNIGLKSRGKYGIKTLDDFNYNIDNSEFYVSTTSNSVLAILEVAENYIKRLNRPLKQVDFTIREDCKPQLLLNTMIAIDLGDNIDYNLDSIIFRIIRLENDQENHTIKVIAIEETKGIIE